MTRPSPAFARSTSALILASVVAGLLAGCSAKPDAAKSDAPGAEAKMPPGVVAITPEQIAHLNMVFVSAKGASEVPFAEVPATIAPPPNARVAVAATIPGVVIQTMVVEGQTVRAGQPLALVASRDVLTMHAALEQASARADVSRTAAQRMAQLAREGVVAGARADEAAATRREAEAQLREQQRTLSLIHAGKTGGAYMLTAPIAGIVTKAAIETGQPVDGTTAPYVVDAADRYELTAQIPERLIPEIRSGMHVSLDGERGTITSVGTTLDPATRSALLRASIPAAKGFVSGRATTVTLLKPAPGDAVEVPSEAVVTIAGKSFVFVRTGQGVIQRAVTSAGEAGGWAVLLSGVKSGDQVAVTGTSELKAMAAAK